MLNLGGSQKRLYVFGQKRVQFNGQKGYSSTRIEKKGTPLGLGQKKDTQQLMYVVQNKQCGESPFLAQNHRFYPFLAIPLFIIFVIVLSLTIYDNIDSINKSLDALRALSDDSYRDSRTNGDTIACEALPMSSL